MVKVPRDVYREYYPDLPSDEELGIEIYYPPGESDWAYPKGTKPERLAYFAKRVARRLGLGRFVGEDTGPPGLPPPPLLRRK